MTSRRDRSSAWIGWSRNLLVVVLGVWYVLIALADPTVFHVVIAVIWSTLAVAMCWSAYASSNGRPGITHLRVNPATVPFDDVVAALEENPGRVEAIRDLRQRHPGLGLSDAVDLVDEVAARPDL